MPVAAVGALSLTLALVLSRPSVPRFGRLNPMLGAIPGVLLMLAVGVLSVADVVETARTIWRPIVTVASIMATTSVAHRLGIFDRVTRSIEIRTRGAVHHAYTTVFVISGLTAMIFNNDAAILLLTPIILPAIRRLYPRRPYLVVPFGFAVFASAGIAPLCTSNPMNLVVAEHVGIGFNAYAARMLPAALVGAVVSYAMLRVVYRKELDDRIPARGAEQGSLAPMEDTSLWVLAIVVAMLASYPVLSYFGAPVWIAAVAGAVLVCAVGLRDRAVSAKGIVDGVAWDILAFLFLIFLTAMGLRNVGITGWLGRIYALAGEGRGSSIALVGAVSSFGSAVLNNHPMAALNALAVKAVPGDPKWRTLAALVGGDLGPRFLPMGSLAGLLWIDTARRIDVEIKPSEFVRTGTLVTVPALAAALATLWIEALASGQG